MNRIKRQADYTFKYNENIGRHGWLRLTPAYSVKLVSEIIASVPKDSFILDPFSGTATSGLVAAERGLSAHCLDINPFLIWLGNAKCRNYSKRELEGLKEESTQIFSTCKNVANGDNWVPNIYNITRWWPKCTLQVLAVLRNALVERFGEPTEGHVSALVWIAFCRVAIETSAAAFNHVSMSFRDGVKPHTIEQIECLYQNALSTIIESASEKLAGSSTAYYADSIELISIDEEKYSHVVTSPPYPNRMSYVRELRPYMYWTKFLDSAREASELDWKSIGGTWGIATSRLKNWQSNEIELPRSLNCAVSQILKTKEKNADLMANYVWKYFHDMHVHLQNLRRKLRSGAVLSYIVGNSSFYGIQVRTQEILAESLASSGFTNIGSKVIRKRNSKKELFEYCVYATWQKSKKCKAISI